MRLKKGIQENASTAEYNMAGLSKRVKPRHRRAFSLFDSTSLQQLVGKKKKQHRRTQSHGTFLTHDLTLNTEESHSGEEKFDLNYNGEYYGSHEVLSPLHMIQYGKALSEPSYYEHDTNLNDTAEKNLEPQDSDDSLCFSKEGLSCIIEEEVASKETESERSNGLRSSESKLYPTSPSSWHSDETNVSFKESNPMDYFMHRTLGNESPGARVDSYYKLSGQISAVSPSMIRMDGSILSPSGDSWIDLGKDSTPRRDLTTKRSKQHTDPQWGIKRPPLKKGNYISLPQEGSNDQNDVIYTDNASKTPTLSALPETREGCDSCFTSFLNEERESDEGGSSVGSSDRKELLSPRKQSTKKTHRRSSRKLWDFFSQAMDSHILLSTEKNAGKQHFVGSPRMVMGEITCWKLDNGAIRMEI